jgi:uncharacterized protein YndB with AHSA1/START domain
MNRPHDTMSNGRVVSIERTIAAPASRIFDVLADPRRHPEIDGSGMVQAADIDGPQRLSLDARFGMAMKLGVRYRMVNTVIEFEEDRRIAWAPKPEVRGKIKEGGVIGGRVWRYDLEPVDGGTLVRETWDATSERGWLIHRVMRVPAKMRRAIETTLANLERAVTTDG